MAEDIRFCATCARVKFGSPTAPGNYWCMHKRRSVWHGAVCRGWESEVKTDCDEKEGSHAAQ